MAQPTKEDIDNFVAVTQASKDDALHFLQAGGGLETAVENYFVAQNAGGMPQSGDQEIQDAATASGSAAPTEGSGGGGGGFTLSGQRVDDTLPAGWGKKPKSRFGGLNQQEESDDEHAGHDHGDDSESEEELFTGGGKNSGLAVLGPDKKKGKSDSLVDNILRTAGENGPVAPPAGRAHPAAPGLSGPSRAFQGGGNTLGGDGTPSTQVPAHGTHDDEDEETDEEEEGSHLQALRDMMSQAGVNFGTMGSGGFDQILSRMGGGQRPQAGGSNFRGQGNVLGSEASPAAPATESATPTRSSISPGPSGLAHIPEEDISTDPETGERVVNRRLTFWRNGFSIADGPLLDYEEPANRALLEALDSGRAPSVAFGVPFDQRVNILVAQRRREDYEPPAKVLKPFEGGGQRLGNVAPSTETRSMPGALPAAQENTGRGAGGQVDFKVDSDKPTTSLQLRFGDGSRQVARFNTTHTVGDIYSFYRSANPTQREFVLQTTFPSKELKEMDKTVEEEKLGGGVVVQRFI
ncbi:hypothetical protein I350_05753 [Cryptococcus amylolentus CBS 6273]|uniref:UBX domain-containing protein n=1 Tax=Cryptococcus amylolentus CBS 6273 TaxID=1296118 RepID=A0A1E3JPU4_9TREE|nr:hypothetical protein I350_05753 [Cryptococcus amylolentus CBS 6273]